MASKDTPAAQEQLFAVANETGQIGLPDFAITDPNDPLAEVTRSIHFMNVLSAMDEVNTRLGFVAANSIPGAHNRFVQSYGDNLPRVVTGASHEAKRQAKIVKTEFARAIGMYAIDDVDTAKSLAREMFTQFRAEYDGTINAKKRKDTFSILKHRVDAIYDGDTQKVEQLGKVMLDDLVLIVPTIDQQTIVTDQQPEAPKTKYDLDTVSRLRAIVEDPRAGYIPATNDEKNMVLSYLDYLDNPAFPRGIHHQFLEVYFHQAYGDDHIDTAEGIKALVSITHVLGDFYTQATQQLANLKDLAIVTSEAPNPKAMLVEEAGENHPGYDALIRHLDMQEYKKYGFVPKLGRNPLRRVRNEQAAVDHPTKNKVIEDQYTRTEKTPVFNKWIQDRIHGNNRRKIEPLLIGDLRKSVNDAIDEQTRRQYFMGRRLHEITTLPQKSKYGVVADTAAEILRTVV